MPPAVRVQSRPRLPLLLGAIAGAVALGIGFELVRPFAAGPVGFDSSASVIYFDRIVSGRHLEAFVTATPKPFLTLVFGLLHELTAAWRSISWATIGAFALCVVLRVVCNWPWWLVWIALCIFGGEKRMSVGVDEYVSKFDPQRLAEALTRRLAAA
jgi:hypothetical protein